VDLGYHKRAINGKQYGDVSKSLRYNCHMIQLYHSWASTQRNVRQYRDSCIPVFIAALFTIAKLWKQLRCPTTDEWIKKMWYIYTMEYYSAISNNDNMWFEGK
jgi:hypothetical protein